MADDQPDSADLDLSSDVYETVQRERIEAVQWLTTPMAVTERCNNVYEAGRAGELEHFRVVEDRLQEAVQYVARTIEARYPSLDIPPHSRWRHFEVAGTDLWQALARGLDEDAHGIARIRFDLAVISVLLDAGAGADWHYRHGESGTELSRSGGLAIASLEAFKAGLFSSDPDRPLMVDADGLKNLDEDRLADAFQAGPDNPLPGLANRVALLRKLGHSLAERLEPLEGELPRPATLFDKLAESSAGGNVSVLELFGELQRVTGTIWPDRLTLAGASLGDTWPHPKAGGEGISAGLVPFHKLCQWMCYSLLEPIEDAGLRLTETSALTPLAEYRNGGLLVDLGLIEPRHERVFGQEHRPSDEIVVEWRALTIPIILAIAENLRQHFAMDAERLPLTAVLEGGTWWAGRRIAAEKRPGGPPPIRVVSDGTVF